MYVGSFMREGREVRDVPAVLGGSPVRNADFPEWPQATNADLKAIQRVLESGHWWQSGNGRAEDFEVWLADYQHCNSAVGVANGTQALELSLRVLEIGPGDEVLVPALTFVASATAVSIVGAVPIPVDVESESWNIDLDCARNRINQRTGAIIAVHLAGVPANLDELAALSHEFNLFLIEDAAQAIGAEWNRRRVGSVGELGTFSFQAAKLLTAGEGGAVVTRRPELAEELRQLANCGRPRGSGSYEHERVAGNSRMSEFHAALLLSQRERLESLHLERLSMGTEVVERLNAIEGVRCQRIPLMVSRSSWYMVVVRVPEMWLEYDGDVPPNRFFAEALRAEGIPASPISIHRFIACQPTLVP